MKHFQFLFACICCDEQTLAEAGVEGDRGMGEGAGQIPLQFLMKIDRPEVHAELSSLSACGRTWTAGGASFRELKIGLTSLLSSGRSKIFQK